MKYRTLGSSALKVSAVSLGSWYTLGTAVDETNSIRLIHTAFDCGINCFDTANAYTKDWGSGAGDVETLLGKALRDLPRSECVIIDKLGGQMGTGANQKGRSGKYLREQCDLSLKRLGLDYLDVCMCHRPMPGDPVEDTVWAMDDLIRQGKVLYWGVSNWAAWRIVKAQSIARLNHLHPMIVSEPRYNLLFRFPELELFPGTRDEGIGHVVYSPLAQGMLTGKYLPGQPPPPGTRAADEHDGKYMRMLYFNEPNKERAAELSRMAADLGTSAGNLAIAWVLHHGQVSSAIIGATKPEQVQVNAAAADLHIGDELYERLGQVFPLRKDVWIGEGEIPSLA